MTTINELPQEIRNYAESIIAHSYAKNLRTLYPERAKEIRPIITKLEKAERAQANVFFTITDPEVAKFVRSLTYIHQNSDTIPTPEEVDAFIQSHS